MKSHNVSNSDAVDDLSSVTFSGHFSDKDNYVAQLYGRDRATRVGDFKGGPFEAKC